MAGHSGRESAVQGNGNREWHRRLRLPPDRDGRGPARRRRRGSIPDEDLESRHRRHRIRQHVGPVRRYRLGQASGYSKRKHSDPFELIENGETMLFKSDSAGVFVRAMLVAITTAIYADAATITATRTIQDAVDRASPGDTIYIPAGTYHEAVRVSKDRITIQGAPGAILDGTRAPGNTGITVSPSDRESKVNQFTLLGLEIRNYAENGVLLN